MNFISNQFLKYILNKKNSWQIKLSSELLPDKLLRE
jgi:hypothetical protein